MLEDFTDTLNMPKTEFEIDEDFINKEIKIKEKWTNLDIYNQIKKKNKHGKEFVVHTNPSNNDGGVSEILKDIINKSKSMEGYNIYDITDKSNMIDNRYISRIMELFALLSKKGLVKKEERPLYFSPHLNKYISESNVEYLDRKDTSVIMYFNVISENEYVQKKDRLLIWTSSPWTLISNAAVCVNEEFEYSRIRIKENIYILETDLIKTLIDKMQIDHYEMLNTFKGKILKGITYIHPFLNRISPIVFDSLVTPRYGTGLVQIAPPYSMEDFIVGKKYNLPLINAIDLKGHLNELSGQFKNLYFEKANEKIIEYLSQKGYILKKETITHKYPHDKESKKPLLIRCENTWILNIEKENILDKINNITFNNTNVKERIIDILNSKKELYLSNINSDGIPLPVLYTLEGREILDYDIIMNISELFRDSKLDIWKTKKAKDFLPKGYKNSQIPNDKYIKGNDILSDWFVISSSFIGILIENNFPYPSDIYLDSVKSIRNWFVPSLILSNIYSSIFPCKSILTHNISNEINIDDIIKKYGSDILRLLIANINFSEDINYSEELLQEIVKNNRKLRNTYKFLLGNIYDFDIKLDRIKYENMPIADRYIINTLNNLTSEITKLYEEYKYDEICKNINNYIINLSNFYLEYTKDILYIEHPDSIERRSVQTVFYTILQTLSKLLAPITPYTSEEVYELLSETSESIHLESFPNIVKYKDRDDLNEMWELFFLIKNDIYKALEEARESKIIGKSSEAKIYLNLLEADKETLSPIISNLKKYLIVSEVIITAEDLPRYDYCKVKVLKSEGKTCERCREVYNEIELTNGLCPRCEKIIKEL